MAWLTMVVLLSVASALAAGLLRWARCPGWPVVGGVLAGLVLGPTIMGRALPQVYESVFVGGAEERRTLDVQRAVTAPPLAPDAGAAEAVAAAEAALSAARHEFQRPLRAMAALLVALVLLGGGALGVPRTPGLVSSVSIGLWSAALPAGLVLLAARWAWSWAWPESMLVAAALAIGPWRLGAFDRQAADEAEVGGARLIEGAGRVATAVALVACAWALRAGGGLTGLAAGWPLLGAVVGWLVGSRGAVGRTHASVLNAVLVPALAASVALRVDLIGDFAFWPAAVVLVVCGDGRWAGALLGALSLGGRRGLRTMRLVLGAMAAGPTQLGVAAVGLNAGLLSGEAALALVLGAVLIESTAPARRAMARRLAETEQALDELRD